MPQHRELLPVTVYLPLNVIDKLEAVAKQEASTISSVARRLLIRECSKQRF